MSKVSLKKLIRQLAAIKGRHTELVTVYIPKGANLHEVAAQLRNEESTAENIKSKQVRKNVTTALDKIIRHMQLYKKTPEKGMAIFCGNISEREGVADIELWVVEPPEDIKVKMYWCDQRFVMEPLQEMVKEKEIYGIICLDKSEGTIALLIGKRIETIFQKESIVPGKTRAGGQSSQRFSRVREGMLNDWLKNVGEAANKIFEEHKDEVIGIIVSGSGPIKEMFMKEDYMHADVKKKVIGMIDTSYTGAFGVEETVAKSDELLKEAEVTKEKKLLTQFLTELQKPHGRVSYGIEDVLKKTEAGAVDKIIVSEASPLKAYELLDPQTQEKKIVFSATKPNEPRFDLIGEKDIIDFLEELAENYGSKVAAVSADTREGQQFLELGGVGALLRYNV
ncbi:MAG: peptide chain release factor subunit 1 [archaeon GW2011_AR5]|nr:MAG: peptide chain release factor subunit 1 [archaeon GW2011_AR5]